MNNLFTDAEIDSILDIAPTVVEAPKAPPAMGDVPPPPPVMAIPPAPPPVEIAPPPPPPEMVEVEATVAKVEHLPTLASNAPPPPKGGTLATYSGGVFGNVEQFETSQRMGKALALSTFFPASLKGKDAGESMSNALVVLELGQRLNLSPVQVAQNVHIIHGRPSFSAKMKMALLAQRSRFIDIQYEMTGEQGKDTWGCVVVATDSTNGQQVRGVEVTIAMAKAEGWYAKNGSKWQTMPELMLKYRAASFFVDTQCPDLVLGIATAEDMEDVAAVRASSIVKQRQAVLDGLK